MLREIAGEQKTIFQVLLLVVFVMVLSGCGGPYIYNSLQHRSITLESGDLQQGGIAFITPSSITGREEDRQSLALTFANTLTTDYPDIRIVGLPETLSAINQANLTKNVIIILPFFCLCAYIQLMSDFLFYILNLFLNPVYVTFHIDDQPPGEPQPGIHFSGRGR